MLGIVRKSLKENNNITFIYFFYGKMKYAIQLFVIPPAYIVCYQTYLMRNLNNIIIFYLLKIKKLLINQPFFIVNIVL